MRITIENRHIKDGKRKSERGCALALAMAEVSPHVIWIGSDTITIRAHRYDHRYAMPEGSAVRRFVDDFDAGRPVMPCTLDLGDSVAWDREGGWWQRGERS